MFANQIRLRIVVKAAAAATNEKKKKQQHVALCVFLVQHHRIVLSHFHMRNYELCTALATNVHVLRTNLLCNSVNALFVRLSL